MRRNSLFWGIALLLGGGILLLDTLGVLTRLEVSAWDLIWPAFLIYLGIWFLLGVSGRRRLVSEEVHQVAIPAHDVSAARITLEFGAASCDVSGDAEPGMVVSGTCEGGAETARTRSPEGHLNIELRSSVFMGPWSWPHTVDRRWDLHLTESIPLTLHVKTGASESHLDLTTLKVTKLKIDSGASSTEVRLPAAAGFTEVRGSSGAASLKFWVPQGVAAHITTSGALAGIHVDQQRFPRREGSFVSPDYETAENKVDIRFDIGVGSIEIR